MMPVLEVSLSLSSFLPPSLYWFLKFKLLPLIHDGTNFCAGFTEIVSYILNFASNNPECITRMLNTVDVEGDTVIICLSFSTFFWRSFLALLEKLIWRDVFQPLHHAARGEQMEVVKILLEAGASPNKTNAYGQVHLLSFLLASVVNQFFVSSKAD